jgi:ribosomal protein S18 acetylase RimI-like enzyme
VQSVYVREDHRRSGVFRLLYAEVMEQARTAGDVVGVRLYVERENARAQATYRHLGMGDAGYLVWEVMLPPGR